MIEQITMKWTLLALLALITFSPLASEFVFDFSPVKNKFDDTLKLAEQGDANSQFNLGYMYRKGEGVIQSNKQAIEWYTKSAVQGYAVAQLMLGLLYDEGKGVTKDYKRAVKWYTKAAMNGEANAQYSLAVMHDNGRGVIQSDKKAYIWWSIAVANGNHFAIKGRDRMAEKLSQKTLEEAQEEAAKLYGKIDGTK
tara:strand:- start:18 stop:602 length:585 start_codon:yes stop_codon:yes gene_type:complete